MLCKPGHCPAHGGHGKPQRKRLGTRAFQLDPPSSHWPGTQDSIYQMALLWSQRGHHLFLLCCKACRDRGKAGLRAAEGPPSKEGAAVPISVCVWKRHSHCRLPGPEPALPSKPCRRPHGCGDSSLHPELWRKMGFH